jgi:hypothetical protein
VLTIVACLVCYNGFGTYISMIIVFLLWLMFIAAGLFIMLENTESSLLEESLLLPPNC